MDNKEQKVLAVERTMTILEYLAQHGANNLSTISKDVKIHKSTLFRFLHTLCSLGYVYKSNETEYYSLTEKMNRFLNMSSNIVYFNNLQFQLWRHSQTHRRDNPLSNY